MRVKKIFTVVALLLLVSVASPVFASKSDTSQLIFHDQSQKNERKLEKQQAKAIKHQMKAQKKLVKKQNKQAQKDAKTWKHSKI
jgi:Ni/Co efflux regulator RcnB